MFAGTRHTGERTARALAASLVELGIVTTYLPSETSAPRIAAEAAAHGADAIELCLARGNGIPLLRELLRELGRIGRQDVSIVIHRVD